jgi:hypothetical protein
MPEELDEEQLEAWTELARIASDETFVEAIRAQTKPVWEEAGGNLDPAGWSAAARAAIDEAAGAVREGRSPTGERGERAIAGWVQASARHGKTGRPALRRVDALPLRADKRSAHGALLGAHGNPQAMGVRPHLSESLPMAHRGPALAGRGRPTRRRRRWHAPRLNMQAGCRAPKTGES